MLKVFLFSSMVLAAREQGVHVHGLGKVTMAFDGTKGKIEMEIPADSIFGFEYEAKSKKDIQTKQDALKKLEDKISEMIMFNSSLGCKISKDKFEVHQEKNHSDVDAGFSVLCQKSPLGSSVSFNFQKYFPRFKKINVDVIVDTVQKSTEVTKNGETLELK
ncbi:MAG: ZrgA family zinc uptake protein [Bdellovibrio sp.]